MGIDLAGKETKPSGFAILAGREFSTGLVHTDAGIIELCTRERPSVVAIDAPLSLPVRGSLRAADRSLIERGLRVFPPTFAGMRSLTERGIRLARKLRERGFEVIEIHPRTSGVILFGEPDRELWVENLRKRGWRIGSGLSVHEIDAVMAALTGYLYIRRETEAVGEEAEGTITVPSPRARAGGRRSGRGMRR